MIRRLSGSASVRSRFRWTPTLVVALAVLVGSVVEPAPGLPSLGPLGLLPLDKWLHGLAYAALAGAVVVALAGNGHGFTQRTPPRRLLLAVVMTTLYGLGIEFVQLALPYRTFSPLDLLADAIGATAGAVVFALLARSRD